MGIYAPEPNASSMIRTAVGIDPYLSVSLSNSIILYLFTSIYLRLSISIYVRLFLYLFMFAFLSPGLRASPRAGAARLLKGCTVCLSLPLSLSIFYEAWAIIS